MVQGGIQVITILPSNLEHAEGIPPELRGLVRRHVDLVHVVVAELHVLVPKLPQHLIVSKVEGPARSDSTHHGQTAHSR